MKLREARDMYEYDQFISILIDAGSDGLIAMSSNNLMGGCCDCCSVLHPSFDEVSDVVRIVDMRTMEVLYDRLQELEKQL